MSSDQQAARPEAHEAYLAHAMIALERLSEDKLATLAFLSTQLHNEQSHHWSRFTAFSALNAGLLILVLRPELPRGAGVATCVLGLLTAATWLFVQLASMRYVQRWKPLYHQFRRQVVGLSFYNEGAERRRKRSTLLALIAPTMMFPAWIMILWVVWTRLP